MLLARIKRYFNAASRRTPAEGEALDRLLDLWRVEAPAPDLAQRIVGRALAMPQSVDRTGTAGVESRDLLLWPRPLLWPAAPAFALAIILGYVAASYSLRTGAEAAGEGLNVADAAVLQEDIGGL